MDYVDYVCSREWHEKRAQAVRRDGYRCRICNSSDDLEVHHRSYGDNGYGSEHVHDLTTVCRLCHATITQMLIARRTGRPSKPTLAEQAKTGHPGALIASKLAVLGITPEIAGPLMGVTKTALWKVVNQKSGVSPQMALRLGRFLGLDPQALLLAQRTYDVEKAAQRIGPDLDAIEPAEWDGREEIEG